MPNRNRRRTHSFIVLFQDRIVLLMAIMLIVAVGVTLRQVASLHSVIIESTALESARLYNDALSEFRTVYTSEVVERLRPLGVKVTHDYRDTDGAIPLPATMSMMLGKRIGNHQSGAEARLYSPYPFPGRQETGGLKDDFAKKAWSFLSQNIGEPFYRFEEIGSRPYLRYATADRMRTSCVSCHNTHPDTPKSDWKEGDLRGVLEIVAPMDLVVADTRTQLAGLSVIVMVATVAGAISLALVIGRLRRQSVQLESAVELRTAELASQEELYRTLIETIPHVIWTADSRGNVTFLNKAWHDWTGLDLAASLGDAWTESLHPQDAPGVLAKWKRAHRYGESYRGECRFEAKDGSYKQIIFIGTPVQNRSGRITSWVGIYIDITDRKQLEDQLVYARKLESIGQLAAGIAHEINTPTQYIGDNTRFLEENFRELVPLLKRANELAEAVREGTGFSELADELKAALEAADVEYLAEEIPRAIEQSLIGIDRVRKIVQSMKEFSHPGVEEMTSLDLNHAIKSTITVATNEWKYVAEMETDFDPELPPVPCLPGELNQVVLNMIVNAAHAIADVVGDGDERMGTIRISTRRDGEFVEIRIADTGTGIPEEARGKIFDPFFTTKEVGKGSGQGLSIAYAVVVQRHGGTLDFDTEIGKGTTFIIRIPLERPAVVERV